jgi:hypothetical protein
MQTWFVFGWYDDAWWPLWEHERHRAKNPYSLLKRIRKRLLDNGEAQYEDIAAVPCGSFWALSVTSNTGTKP